jgi:hypothetical protein
MAASDLSEKNELRQWPRHRHLAAASVTKAESDFDGRPCPNPWSQAWSSKI